MTLRNRQYLPALLTGMAMVLPVTVFAADRTETAGDILQIIIPAVGYGATYYLDDSEGRTQFYKSFFTSLGITYSLKYAIDRKRPNGGDHSFPSGHTSAAFQGAAFIQQRYGWQYGMPAYLAAAFVGYSRVESRNHYVSDVIAGAAIGTLSSWYFTKPRQGVSVTPVVSRNYAGIVFQRNW